MLKIRQFHGSLWVWVAVQVFGGYNTQRSHSLSHRSTHNVLDMDAPSQIVARMCYLQSECRASLSRKSWSRFAHSMSMGNLQSDTQREENDTVRRHWKHRLDTVCFISELTLHRITLTASYLPLNNCTYWGKPAARSQSQASLASISANSERENSIWFNYNHFMLRPL